MDWVTLADASKHLLHAGLAGSPSNEPNRSNPTLLDGSTQSGKSYIFTRYSDGPTGHWRRVSFYLDGTLKHTENFPPYDFAGGTQELAYPWDTTTAIDGRHTVRAEVLKTDGTKQNASATFTVDNANPTPAGYTLQESNEPNRSNPTLLDGSTQSGKSYIFTRYSDGPTGPSGRE